ncbi:MAG: hypothetical protein PHT96_10245 [Syntrophorhabdaceae bacterium]|nr:hypothetical protein [Syntrophorhabdaceae bacterium]MDD4196771.1 hypothetical protein [Syntrophorhabdaceae bacterium]
MNFIQRILIEPLERFYEQFLTFIPNLLTSIALLIIGVVLGSILRLIFLKIFRAINLDKIAQRIGLFEMFARKGARGSLSAFIARLIGWIAIFIFAAIAVQSLRIPSIENLIERFFLYLPNVFTALVILAFGYIFSNFLGRAALIASVNAGIRRAGMVGRFVKLVVFILSATMAMEQLGIGRDTVLIAFAIVFGGIVLALAIAFGFGGRDIARDYLQRNVNHPKEQEKDIEDHINPL